MNGTEAYRTETYRGYTIEINIDEYPENPREWDNVAEFVCKHSHYHLGDRHDVDECVDDLFARYCPDWDSDGRSTADKLRKVNETGNVVWCPISVYDHSGITMWLGSTYGHPDACWDCSTVGFAYVEKESSGRKYDPNWKEWALEQMKTEMKVYNAYLKGEVFQYSITDADDEDIDACGGWYGTDTISDLLDVAKKNIDRYIARVSEEHKKHLSFVREHLADICGRMWITNGYVYMVGPDMYGLPEFSRAKATPDTDLNFSYINLQDLPHKALSCLVHFVSKP